MSRETVRNGVFKVWFKSVVSSNYLDPQLTLSVVICMWHPRADDWSVCGARGGRCSQSSHV